MIKQINIHVVYAPNASEAEKAIVRKMFNAFTKDVTKAVNGGLYCDKNLFDFKGEPRPVIEGSPLSVLCGKTIPTLRNRLNEEWKW